MKVRSLSKRLEDLSAQHGGKIPFGSMKDKGASKDKGKTTIRRRNNSKIQRQESKTRRRKRTKKAYKAKAQPKAKSKGEPSMSPRHIGEHVIHRGIDGDLYEVKREKGETSGKWVKVKFKRTKP
mgnify:CR=1 FL=1